MKTGFLDLLDSKEIGESDGKTIYRLNSHLRFVLNYNSMVIVPEGFETDLASVPRLPLVYAIWGNRAHREAVMHDYLYRKDAVIMCYDSRFPQVSWERKVTKEDADWYFRLAMISRGQPYYIYQPMYLAVRSCGGPSFHRMMVNDHFKLDGEEK